MRDRTAITLCLVGLVIVTILLARPTAHTAPSFDAPSGRALAATDGVRRRAARSLAWEPLQTGDPTFANDTVFVPPGASALLALDDGSRLSVAPNSLIVLTKSAFVAQPSHGLVPAIGARLYASRVRFSWPEGASADFAGQTHDKPFERTLAPGTYEWQVGEHKAWFTVEADAAPRLLSPRHLEMLSRQRFDAIPFAWTATPGAEQYIVELLRDGHVVKAITVTGTRTWIASDLPEGVIKWRVRAEGTDRPPITSAAESFRFSVVALPDAPEVYDPEVDLGR